MELNNALTNGTKIFNDSQSYARSSLMIPMNEDYTIVVSILSYSISGIVSGTKVWQENGEKKVYYALAKYLGRAGTPLLEEVNQYANTVFYRVGDFNSQGNNGFELHNEDVNKTSWVCFIPYQGA
jgi:hypothetical protein